ncbi:hypothetical protein [Nonomuraea sp. NPDC050310]|uniref:hypothetical protein n=1 Tax=Nonomuraea sp. NPDC050310 TaxID=3154935 RepID=UPI0033D9D466
MSSPEALVRMLGHLAGRVRSGRALHNRGVLLSATLVVAAAPGRPLGLEVFDRPGRTEVVVRLSKGTGLPGRLPDVLGLAVRLPDTGGRHVDLLLSTCGAVAWLPWPRAGFTAGPYSSLASYRHRSGLFRLLAVPDHGLSVPADPALLEPALKRGPLVFRLYGVPGHEFARPLATLEVRDVLAGPDVAFDPVVNSAPAMPPAGVLQRLRRAAYDGSRRARRARLD